MSRPDGDTAWRSATKQRRAAVELSLRGFTDDQIAVVLVVPVDRAIALIYGNAGLGERDRST